MPITREIYLSMPINIWIIKSDYIYNIDIFYLD